MYFLHFRPLRLGQPRSEIFSEREDLRRSHHKGATFFVAAIILDGNLRV